MKIGIIGLGYVGLTLAICAASKGLTVYGIEIDPVIMESLKQNHAHFYEPGIDNLISRYKGKNFFPSREFPDDVDFDAFIVTVGTPLKDDSKEPNFDYILSALDSIKHIYNGKQLIILRSTVSVGTTRYPMTIMGNMFVTDPNQYPVYAGSTTVGVAKLDYNNYYGSGTYVGYYGGAVSSIAAWRSNTSDDAHSVSEAVSFVNTSTSLKLKNYFITKK